MGHRLSHETKSTASAGHGLRGGWFLRDFFIMLVSALVLFGLVTQLLWYVAPRQLDRRVLVRIPEGATLRRISAILEDQGLTRDARRFELAARAFRLDSRLQAGLYEFGPDFSEMEVLLVLKSGEVARRRLTVPEGYRATQIAALLDGVLGIDSGEFMELVHDPEFISEKGLSAPSLEGYLHPDTYHFRLDSDARSTIERMVGETLSFFDGGMRARADSLGLTRHQVLTLASIIESEAMLDSERGRISAVYHNRLERGWRLEADPTVRYALGNYRRKLYYGDLDADSPYNTYRNAGLPPGPICSPGRASIRAALYPTRDSRDFFFVANGDGSHTFSESYREHIEAQQRTTLERKDERAELPLDPDSDG